MIFMYPMLVSNTVSANIIPGVCKSLEKFTLAYRMTRAATEINSKNFRLRENEDVVDYDTIIDSLLEGPRDHKQQGSSQANSAQSKAYQQNMKQLKKHQNSPDDQTRNTASVSLDLKQMASDVLSVEPTFVTMEIEKNGLKMQQVIGIKVVPYSVTSDLGLAQLLLSDSAVSDINSRLISMGRSVKQKFWKAWNTIKNPIPLIGGPVSATGDPRHDILMGRSKYGNEIFVCMNYMDLRADFFRERGPKKIDQLQRMGWHSLVFPDDVQKRVYYCMKEFGGVCSVVPYSMVYSSIGSGSAGAYENLEDVRKTTSPFFRRKKIAASKLMNEHVDIENVIEGFLNKSGVIPLNEGLDGVSNMLHHVIKSGSPQLNRMKEVLQDKDVEKLKSMKNMLPKTTTEEIIKYASDSLPEFNKYYNLSKRVYANSIGMKIKNDKLGLELMSIMAATRAASSKNPGMAFKEIIKKSTYEIEEAVDPSVTPITTDTDLTLGGIIFAGLSILAGSTFIGAIMTFSSPVVLAITLGILSVFFYRMSQK